jgi:hypothetical protein
MLVGPTMCTARRPSDISRCQIISELGGTGVAVLLIEQNARAALQISDYGYGVTCSRQANAHCKDRQTNWRITRGLSRPISVWQRRLRSPFNRSHR